MPLPTPCPLVRSRIEEKSAKYEQFKKQQRLYPEYAGVYADTFLANPQALHHYQELLVFNGTPSAASIAGVLQCEPHTTLRELRQKLQEELGFRLKEDTVLDLSRGTYSEAAAAADGAAADGAVAAGAVASGGEPIDELVPLPTTQNHKLVYPLFPSSSHVLVVGIRKAHISDEVSDGGTARRAEEGGRAADGSWLMADGGRIVGG